MILPKAISSIAGAPNTVNGYTFIPTDDAEVEQDAPLSTRLRRREFGNLYHIYKNRPGACVGWSEDMDYRVGSQAFTTTDDDWVEVVRITVFVPRGTEFIRWGLFGRKTGSGTGKVRLRTASMDNNEDTPIEVDVVNSWSSPYTSNLVKYDDVGAGKLNVYPGSKELTQDALIVDIKSDGSARVDLAGLTAWFEVVT